MESEITLPKNRNQIFSKRTTRIIWILLLLGGLFLFTYRITHEALWFDESYTAAMVKHPLKEIWWLTSQFENFPPLYYLTLKIFISFFGSSIFRLRFFSTLGALALAALGYEPLRRISNNTVGILYTFLILIVPATTVMAQEARMYTWGAFFVTGCAFYGILAIQSGKLTEWILFVIFSVLAIYTHYYALLAVASMYGCIFLWQVKKLDRRLLGFSMTSVFVMICFLPWMKFLVINISEKIKYGWWVPEISLEVIYKTLVSPFSYQFDIPDIPLTSYIAIILLVCFFMIGCWHAIKRYRLELNFVYLSALGFILPLGVFIAASYILFPVLVPRYMFLTLGILLVPMVYGISNLPNQNWILLICLLLFSLAIPQILKIKQGVFKSPMNEIVQYLDPLVKTEDVFIHANIHSMGLFSFYFPENAHFLYDAARDGNYRDTFYSRNGMLGSRVDKFVHKHNTIWFTDNLETSDQYTNPGYWNTYCGINPGENNTEFKLPNSWFKVKLCRYEQP